jgi:hypothetical protein
LIAISLRGTTEPGGDGLLHDVRAHRRFGAIDHRLLRRFLEQEHAGAHDQNQEHQGGENAEKFLHERLLSQSARGARDTD